MKLTLDLQVASTAAALPDHSSFERWVKAALPGSRSLVELSIRLVDEDEGRQLNSDYRGRDYPTNVLSFPFELPAEVDDAEAQALLGDLVICAPVVAREANEQTKPLADHWAHLVVHGTLHLLGHDHEQQNEAEAMEALEVSILQRLGIADPYLITDPS